MAALFQPRRPCVLVRRPPISPPFPPHGLYLCVCSPINGRLAPSPLPYRDARAQHVPPSLTVNEAAETLTQAIALLQEIVEAMASDDPKAQETLTALEGQLATLGFAVHSFEGDEEDGKRSFTLLPLGVNINSVNKKTWKKKRSPPA